MTSWDVPLVTEAINAQASQQQIVLLSRIMTLTLAHCAEDMEARGEQTMFPPQFHFPVAMTKVSSKLVPAYFPVPSSFGKPCQSKVRACFLRGCV